MKVRATQLGFDGMKRRRAGEVFMLKPKKGFKQDKLGKLVPHTFTVEEQFSAQWMEKVDGKAKAQPTEEIHDDQEANDEVL